MKAIVERFFKIFRFFHKTSSGAAEGKRGPDDQGKSNFLRNFLALQKGGGGFAFTYFDVEFMHLQPELLPVFGCFDGFDVDPDNFHPEFLPNTCFFAINGQIQGRLTTHSRKYGINLVRFQDFNDGLFL